jgi:hypothetical protein
VSEPLRDEGTVPIWGLPGVAGVLGGWFAGGILGSVIAVALFGAEAATNPWTYPLVFVSQTLAGTLGLAVLTTLRGRRSFARDFGLMAFPVDLIWLVAGVGLQIVSILVAYVIVELAGGKGAEQDAVRVLRDAGLGAKVALAICFGLLAPVIEELIFRGAFQRALQRHLAVPIAVLTQAAFFAFVHLSDPEAYLGLPSIFAVGLLAGFLAARTNRLGPAIALHAGFNLTVVLLTFFV